MMSTLVRILLLSIIVTVLLTKADDNHNHSSLVYLLMVIRHGARTPVTYIPGDPNNDYWVDKPGQLTNVGKEQLYFYGQQTRKRYDGFLDQFYKSDEVTALSTKMDRTIMSAQSFLAGLYPPKSLQIWNPSLNWQPIPVYLLDSHVSSVNWKEISKAVSNCPANKSLSMYDTFSRYQDTISTIENVTGNTEFTCSSLKYIAILDVFDVETFYNLTLPLGLNNRTSEILELKRTAMTTTFGSPQVASLINGRLLNHISNMISNKRNESLHEKAHLLFMHDLNIVGLLALLTNSKLSTPFASSIIFELHQVPKTNNFNIKMFFRESPYDEPQRQYIKDCGYVCPLDKFSSIVNNVSKIPDYLPCPC